MRVLQGHPTVSGQDTKPPQNKEPGTKALPLVVGWTTYIREEVEVVPALDLLIVTSQPLKGGRVVPS